MSLPFELQETEQVVVILRRHWLHLYPRLLGLVLVAAAPAMLFWVATTTVTELGGTARSVVVGVLFLWAFVWLVRAYFLWYRYEHDIWVITNQRIVDSLKRNWFHHRMSSADLVDIQDVSVDREGVLRTLFDFGDVEVETAAEEEHFMLSAIPHPDRVLATVDAERDRARREQRGPG
jgi:membrane protein YdbS with pleckstrin-like domain